MDIVAEKVDFSGAVEHVLESMPMPEALNGCKAYGFEGKATLRKATGTNAEFKLEAQKEAPIAVAERRGTWRLFSQREVERRLL